MSSLTTSPMILLLIVLLAVIFFTFGLVHLLLRYLMKNREISLPASRPNGSPAALRSLTFQRQLQHLFQVHDSGLDHAIVEALPVFYYTEVKGLGQPFDCAVCLSEFSDGDCLKLLVNCSHAFHVHCIETWLLSNSTCPLCRGLVGSEASVENQHSTGIRLGKFRSSNDALLESKDTDGNMGSSSGTMDARRCYSMGAFQYVMSDAELQVTFSSQNGDGVKFKAWRKSEQNEKMDGEKIDLRSRGDSLSISKIWLWAKKGGELPSSSDTNGRATLPGPMYLAEAM